MDKAAEPPRRFWRIASAGVLFQGGAAAVDTSTIIAALVHGLTGSLFAVGAAAAIARTGWLVPQVIVGYLAQRRRRRLGFYVVGALGRVAALAGVGVFLAGVGDRRGPAATAAFFALWTAYAFVSGIVAVPYNDIVARSIPSERRSRMLAIRFFGGGVLALAVAGLAARLIGSLAFPLGHSAVVAIATLLLLGSALCFVSAGEPDAVLPAGPDRGFGAYLHAGIEAFGSDRRLRLTITQRCAAARKCLMRSAGTRGELPPPAELLPLSRTAASRWCVATRSQRIMAWLSRWSGMPSWA